MTVSRNPNVECLRILAMLLIVMYHVALPIIDEARDLCGLAIWVLNIFGSWGILGVDIFIIISSYYLSEVESVSFSKCLKILTQTYCFTFFFYLLSVFVSQEKNLSTIVTEGLLEIFTAPLFMRGYWFVWAYVVLMLLIPALNKIKINAKTFLLVVLIFLVNNIQSYEWVFGADIVHFVCVYLFTNYVLKTYKQFIDKYGSLIIFILPITLLIICHIAPSEVDKFLIGRYSIVICFLAVIIFGKTINRNVSCKEGWYCRAVNIIASSMFGVYLFHTNYYMFLSPYVPEFLLKRGVSSMPTFFISVIFLFLGGLFVDRIYKRIASGMSLSSKA